MESPQDEELAKLAMGGDEEAFQELIQRNYDLVYRLSYRWCRQQEDAEDITQDVLVKVARKLGSFNFDSSFQTWLYRITVNAVKDFFKQQEHRRNLEKKFLEEKAVELQGVFVENIRRENFFDYLEKLPLQIKESVMLVFGEGMNHKEAAIILNCAESTISWRIFQAKRKIKKMLDQKGCYD